MEKIIDKDSLDSYRNKMSHNRRVIAQARAIIQRSKSAGIPDKYLRINRQKLKTVIDDHYHKDVDSLLSNIYDKPMDLMKKEFIIIDGGTMMQRKLAGFALLFRFISCDKCGLYKHGTELAHQLQSINVNSENLSRNDLADSLRHADILFISEILKTDFRKGFETGRFFDEILSYRDDYVKPTIISFANPLPSLNSGVYDDNEMTEQDQYGQYMCTLSRSEKSKNDKIFRIRVKNNG